MAVAASGEDFLVSAQDEDVEQGQFGAGYEDVTFLSNAEVAVILSTEEDSAPNKKQTECVCSLPPLANQPCTLPCAAQHVQQVAQLLQKVWRDEGGTHSSGS